MEEYPALTDENPYIFNSVDEQPWNENAAAITSLRFGSAVSPTSLAFWLRDTAVASINWANCDTSNVTSIWSAFANTQLVNIKLPSMPELENLQFAFAQNAVLETVDLSDVNSKKIDNMKTTFKGSNAIREIDLTGLGGKISNAQNAFSNDSASSPDMALTTIYAGWELDFTEAARAGAMFRACVDLVGGAGTTYNSSNTGSAYAHPDEGTSNPGYFTDKNAPAPVETVIYNDAFNLNGFDDIIEIGDNIPGASFKIESSVGNIMFQSPNGDPFTGSVGRAAYAISGVKELPAKLCAPYTIQGVQYYPAIDVQNGKIIIRNYRDIETVVEMRSIFTTKITQII